MYYCGHCEEIDIITLLKTLLVHQTTCVFIEMMLKVATVNVNIIQQVFSLSNAVATTKGRLTKLAG